MNYNSLVAPKGTAGSVMSWVNYTKLDIPTVVDEAQSLLYTLLRTREMRTEWFFSVNAGGSQAALPARFLDPIGKLLCQTGNISHMTEAEVSGRRVYEADSGSLGVDAVSQNSGSLIFAVYHPNHGLTVGSDYTINGATNVGSRSPNGSYKVVVIVDANNIAIYNPDAAVAVTTASGGGSLMTFASNTLIAGYPTAWSIWDGLLQFDAAFDTAAQFRLMYYRSLALLSSLNPTNFLTDRYPMLMRKACQTAAADFMKDDTEYQKNLTALNGLVGTVAAQDDLAYRGAEFGTDTP